MKRFTSSVFLRKVNVWKGFDALAPPPPGYGLTAKFPCASLTSCVKKLGVYAKLYSGLVLVLSLFDRPRFALFRVIPRSSLVEILLDMLWSILMRALSRSAFVLRAIPPSSWRLIEAR